MFTIAMWPCCPKNYDPETGLCRSCGYCYDKPTWTAHCRTAANPPAPEPTQDAPEAVSVTPSPPVKSLESYCLHCGKLFTHTRKSAVYCSTKHRVAAKRAADKRAAACQWCGAEDQAPYCNDHCAWQDKKQYQLMRHGGRSNVD